MQGTPFEKGNAEEDGNCAIHGRPSNRPLRSFHWNQIVYRHPFEHQTKLAWRLSALLNQILDFFMAEMTSRYRPSTIDHRSTTEDIDPREDELASIETTTLIQNYFRSVPLTSTERVR
jgi:hypothetical protein